MTSLSERWADLVDEMGWPDTEQATALGDEIVARYDEPHRRYHAVVHLRSVLDLLDELADDRTPLPTTRLAAWFHDVVYDPTADDNEERSADLAVERLTALGTPAETVQLVADLVLATKTHQPGDLPEADLLLDADLATLGIPPEAYLRTSAAVREEYAHVPDDLYAIGRPMVLRSFLERERIFLTPLALERYEAPARANLIAEIERLEAPPAS